MQSLSLWSTTRNPPIRRTTPRDVFVPHEALMPCNGLATQSADRQLLIVCCMGQNEIDMIGTIDGFSAVYKRVDELAWGLNLLPQARGTSKEEDSKSLSGRKYHFLLSATCFRTSSTALLSIPWNMAISLSLTPTFCVFSRLPLRSHWFLEPPRYPVQWYCQFF
ncbi:hypothetical protein E1B28_002060 [Marasmius oreades]|uniref:Uncharacterized protein n=1 Tax=Marasmius oreades TaxID=181124 RepID=A0A9P8AG41_9AGAR|nr:uncharacterized protein E1B28_002060 [Marasmius oreades]KAG7100287.1 hypothetical protein E1B28_002060 [Marasmius oreades]